MEKRNYMKPEAQVVTLRYTQSLLAGSLGTTDKPTVPGGSLVSKKRFAQDIDPWNWEITSWDQEQAMLDEDE